MGDWKCNIGSIYEQHTEKTISDSIKEKEDVSRGIVYGGIECHVQEVTQSKRPFQIAVAVIDKRCPICGASRKYGFDLGFSNSNIFGGLCFCCGWSF